MQPFINCLCKAIELFLHTSCIITGCVACYFLCRIFIIDQFVIPSDSMYPALHPGDRVWVNKLIAGARLYECLDSAGSSTLRSWRTRGMRRIARNDILIFNYPINDGRIAFKINYVYAKRCIALPGDSICAVNGYYRNNRYPHILGDKRAQDYLNSIPDSTLDEGIKYTLPYSYDRYPWNIRNFGPVYVPRKGDVMTLNSESVIFYSQLLEFETGKRITIDHSKVLADGTPLNYHVFKHNYYFTAGDNVMNSSDSRYWGFVPEEYITGIIYVIPFSKNKDTDYFRWDRIFKAIYYPPTH